MDAAIQKLVDEARWLRIRILGADEGADAMRVADALEALADALEAPQRSPVSPEEREEIRAVVGEQLTKAGLDLDGPPYSDDGETQWPVALELRDRLTDAILARWSVPSQPVYDEEKIARWLFAREQRKFPASSITWEDSNRAHWRKESAALVAALRGGELTVDGTSSDA